MLQLGILTSKKVFVSKTNLQNEIYLLVTHFVTLK